MHHLYLLHEIFPSGPWGLLFLALILLVMLAPVVALFLALVGLGVVARAERLYARPAWLRRAVHEGPRPSVRLWLFVITACVMAGVLLASGDGGARQLGMIMLMPADALPNVGLESLGPMLMLAVAFSAAFWVLVITGVRALVPALRERGSVQAT